jgi:hypothetical protein
MAQVTRAITRILDRRQYNMIIACFGAWPENEHLTPIQKEDYYV